MAFHMGELFIQLIDEIAARIWPGAKRWLNKGSNLASIKQIP